MALPIIFFHNGNAEYLKYSLKQARYFNPDSVIYLLGDKKNNRYPFVTHVLASKYQQATNEFAHVYKHRSPNSENYELNCFLRWFYIRDFCKDQGIDEFMYLDSDVLLFQDFSKLTPFFKGYKIANTCDWTGMPAVTWFRDQQVLGDFCNFLIYAYTDNNAIAKLESWYETSLVDPVMLGGISDMVLFHFYFQEHPDKTLKIDLVNNEIAVDVSINREDGYEMENGMKKIYWQDNLPYAKNLSTGKLVRFAALHYQGYAKDAMRKHYTAGGYRVAKYLEANDIKGRLKRTKKAVKNIFKGKKAP